MIWQPNHRTPERPGEVALIAVKCEKHDPTDCDCYLLAELYRFDPHFGCWIGEGSGLKLKHAEFWWMPETELLETLP